MIAHPLPPSAIESAAQFLTQTFRNEQSYQAMLGNHRLPEKALLAYFRFFLRLHQPHNCLFYSGEDVIQAFFLFEPPSLHLYTLPKMLRAGLLKLISVAGIGMARRMAQMGRQFQACRLAAAPNGSAYVGLIAIHPSLQGRGLGNQWMQEAILPHIRENSNGLPVVLYTQEPHLVKWYKKNGFVIKDQRMVSVKGSSFENTTMAL